MTKQPSVPANPLHARCLELCQDLQEHLQLLRDYATTPGNAWLAKGEIQQTNQLISELDSILDEIKREEDAGA